MLLSKIHDISDISVYIDGNILPGVIYINENTQPTLHCVRAFGEGKPVSMAEQPSLYTVKLKLLYFDGYIELKRKKGFDLSVCCDKATVAAFSDCSFSEISLDADSNGKVYINACVTSQNKL